MSARHCSSRQTVGTAIRHGEQRPSRRARHLAGAEPGERRDVVVERSLLVSSTCGRRGRRRSRRPGRRRARSAGRTTCAPSSGAAGVTPSHVGRAAEQQHAGDRGCSDRDCDEQHARHRAHRLCRRSSAQAMNARSIAGGSLVPSTTGSRPSETSSASSRRSRSSCAARRRAACARREADERDAARCAGRRSARPTPATAGKLCSQTGSWITTGTRSQPCATASSHALAGGGDEEVGEHEDERAAAAGRCAAPPRNVERALDVVLGRVERRRAESLARRATRRSRAARAAASTARRRAEDRARRCRCAPRPRSRRSRSRPRRAHAASRARAAAAGKTPIAGRRSLTSATRGASSAERSRTTNSSRPRAAESRAVANQSIVETGSPGCVRAARRSRRRRAPRRRLGRSPNGSPTRRRRRGTSGKVCRSRTGTAQPASRRRVPVRARAAARARGSGP